MKTLCIVTGASKGFGKACVQELVKVFNIEKSSCHFVITARSPDLLCKLKEEISSDLITVHDVICDSGDLINATTHMDKLFNKVKDVNDFERTILVNNVGTLSDLNKTVKELDYENNAQELIDYTNLNFNIPLLLTIRFLKLYGTKSGNLKQSTIVNVSSLLAVQPMKNWSIYASFKAARDSLHSCIATEEDSSFLKTLNWAPGPLDTEMQLEVRTTIGDLEAKKALENMLKEDKFVKPNDSAAKLAKLVQENNFESGKHIDYYDV